MASDSTGDLEASFGDFSIEGMQDPLTPHDREDYVEELDPDPAPMVELGGHDADRLPWFGASPWSGTSDLHIGSRRLTRVVTMAALVTVVAGAAALVIWRLVG